MKLLISASIVSITMLASPAGALDASRPMFADLPVAAPSSATFEDPSSALPLSGVFIDIERTAPRSDGVYGTLEDDAP